MYRTSHKSLAGQTLCLALVMAVVFALSACGSGGGGSSLTTDSSDSLSASASESSTESGVEAADITNQVFEQRSADCADYENQYASSVLDIQRSLGFEGSVVVLSDSDFCVLESNNIPNHDFNDASAYFATNVSEVSRSFEIPRNSRLAVDISVLSQQSWDAVMLNGVVLDLLSAGCYRPNDPMADADGNVHIGCNTNDPWLLDPLGTEHKFGADEHNAHTQPDGTYHYHGNPNAMFDDNPGPNGSPVIGFAADGFPIYGSYFLDPDSGAVRKALSGYSLKSGSRPDTATDPGGDYDGLYVDDWEFTDSGDLDACNGMTVDGQYGYYVTDTYPWVLACHSGTPDPSFLKF